MVAARVNKREAILDAASRLIRDEGVHAASVAEIIAKSGSSAGTIYHHFANKNEVVLAVARRTVVEPLQAAVIRHEGEAMSPGQLFRTLVETVVAGELESKLIVQLWAGSSTDPQLYALLQAQMDGVRAGMTEMMRRWLAERGDPDADGRAPHLAHVTVGQAMGLLAARIILTEIDFAAYVEEAAALLDRAGDPGAVSGDRSGRG